MPLRVWSFETAVNHRDTLTQKAVFCSSFLVRHELCACGYNKNNVIYRPLSCKFYRRLEILKGRRIVLYTRPTKEGLNLSHDFDQPITAVIQLLFKLGARDFALCCWWPWRFVSLMVVPRSHIPANIKRWTNVGLQLGQRRRRWANSKPTLDQRHMFEGTPEKWRHCVWPLHH